MRWIEFQLLPLLDRFSNVHPRFLEQQLASDPKFFHDMKEVAKIVDREDLEELRRGLRTELFNRRGVFSYTSGRDEQALATRFREFATKFDLEGLTRIATTLRSMADGYERDAKREAGRDPFHGE